MQRNAGARLQAEQQGSTALSLFVPTLSGTRREALGHNERHDHVGVGSEKRKVSELAPLPRRPARHFFAEQLFRSNALHCTAMTRILILAQCSAIS